MADGLFHVGIEMVLGFVSEMFRVTGSDFCSSNHWNRSEG